MDEKTFDETVERLRKANGVVSKLDPAIRAEAFSILAPYVKGTTAPRGGGGGGGDAANGNGGTVQAPSDRDDLLTRHGSRTPVDNVLVACAAWYMDYGTSPFSQPDIREIIDDAGLTGPTRIDRSLDTVTKGQGKALFRKASRGKWAPTVAGEQYFRETFGVPKGRKKPDEPDSS